MKKLLLRNLLKEENFISRLKLGTFYEILDLGTNKWVDNFEYIGVDTNTNKYMFRMHEDGTVDKFMFMSLSKPELTSDNIR